MRITLINFSNDISTIISYRCNDDFITTKPNEILKINESNIVVNAINKEDLIIILLNRETFNISSILSLLSLAKEEVSKIALFIDASDLTKEEEVLFDDLIEEITDFISCIITDNKEYIVSNTVEYISNYKYTH